MSANTVNLLLDERARLVAKLASSNGTVWAAEHLLTRVAKLLAEAIMPTPALSAHRDVIVEEIHELLAEEREHPGAGVLEGIVVPGEGGAGEAPPSPGILPDRPGPY